MKPQKMPRDTAQLAKRVVDLATGQVEPEPERPEKHQPSVELGRKGGLVGGPKRAAKLSPERRAEIARKAAQARWRNS
jgi:hypothetical protein